MQYKLYITIGDTKEFHGGLSPTSYRTQLWKAFIEGIKLPDIKYIVSIVTQPMQRTWSV